MSVQVLTTANVDFGEFTFSGSHNALTVAFTCKVGSVITSGERLVTKWSGLTADQIFIVQCAASDEILFAVCDRLATLRRGVQTTDSPVVAGSLLRIVCRWRASDQLTTIWINGVARTTTPIFSDSPTGLSFNARHLQVGLEDAESIQALDGQYSELYIATSYATDEWAMMYGAGFSPLFCPLSNQKLYSRLININDLIDIVGSQFGPNNGTNNGGTSTEHPHMIYPAQLFARRMMSVSTDIALFGRPIVHGSGVVR